MKTNNLVRLWPMIAIAIAFVPTVAVPAANSRPHQPAPLKSGHGLPGATMPFRTYEAEDASLGRGALANVVHQVKEVSSAKGYVQLGVTGAYVQFSKLISADRLIVRYSVPDSSSGTLSLYVNGTFRQKLHLSSIHCYDSAPGDDPRTRRYDEKAVVIKIPAGSTIKLEKDADDTCAWYGIDLIDLETAPTALRMPAHYLSIASFGADGTGTSDSRPAIVRCISAAQAQHKNVWIPVGTFSVSSRTPLPAGMDLSGAGDWYSCLYYPNPGSTWADAIGFADGGHNTIANIKFVGNGVARMYATILLRPVGNYTTVDRCWVQNVGCVYGWENFNHVALTSCRVYGTWFDGIHWGDGAAFDNVARNNYFRGEGDDSVAQVDRTDMGLAHDNLAEHNTIVASYSGRGMSDVGGDSLTLRDNLITSCYISGIYIATEPLSPTVICRPVRGLNLLRDVVLQCGHTGHNLAGIHFWLYTNPMQGVVIDGCTVKYGETDGIHFDNTKFGDSAGRTVIKKTIVEHNAGAAYADANKDIVPILIGNTMK